MYGYQPQVGEQMGFFVSAGNARGTTTVTSVRERSNVVLVNLPANDTGVFTNFFIPTTPLLWQNTSTRQVTAWQMGGSGGSVLQDWGYVSSSGVPGWTIVATGDFDGDGYQDVVWQNDVTRQVTVWYMVGTAFKGWNYISSGSVPGWSVVGSGDFNSDGKPDLVWQNDSTGEILVWYLFGAQGNMFLTWSYLSNGLPVPAGWKVVAVADFNGDGKPDVVGQNDSTRQLAIAYMGGGGGNVVLNYVTLGGVAGWRVVGAKDFDRDGRPDLVWQNDSTAQVTVWYMDGAQGDTMRSWNYLSSSNLMGWRALAR
jgi:hypothetical protein